MHCEESVERNSPHLIPLNDARLSFLLQFGKSIKMGIIEDAPNRSKLAKLLRFRTSASDGQLVSLEEYVARMPDWQQEVYFIAGESINTVKKSPFLEVASKKKVEVLYLVEPIDECERPLLHALTVCTHSLNLILSQL